MKLAILLVVGVIANVYGDEPEPIVGGNMAYPGQFKHQVSIQEDGYHICGGSIISSTHILTAAHCISSPSIADRLTVVTGTNKVIGDGELYKVKSVVVHPGFSMDHLRDDIAILTLEEPIPFNSRQNAIPLASKDYADGINRGMVSGWGKLGASSGTPLYLQYIDVTLMKPSECQKAHPETTSKQLCTNEVGQGVCMGDSGGPLIHNRELVGIVSWGIPCAVGQPDVYTNVYHYTPWIEKHTL
ncbi:chymotrypsin-1-like [Odontomachus brunneus]|uniref:chymotrypsin-1-like n=1 Tax=Odontomachus brunneus TaxID=486640 RepID=UPI0013F27E3C|nr:chymotrypsin-1-like [Odontomachus brunneus]